MKKISMVHCLFTVTKGNTFLFLITGAGYHINKPNLDHLTGYPVKGWNSNISNGTKGKCRYSPVIQSQMYALMTAESALTFCNKLIN